MKAETITLTPNGRLTEHTAHVDISHAPEVSYRNTSGKMIKFIPMKLIITFQWSWTTNRWHLLEVKATGRNGVQPIKTTFRNPDTAPEWVRDAIVLVTPALVLPKENDGES